MNTGRNDAKAIFLEAIEKATPEERSHFVERACAGDRELRRRVEQLLSSFDDAGSFMEERPGAALMPTRADASLPEGPGTIIGAYKLLQRIGEGGMGVVYMAEQTEPVSRRVALKIIKPGMDSRQVIARFEAERQALAMMDHPNIAKVLDAGTTDSGRPYFVMELVKGIPITRFSDDNHLTPRERLDLFTPVCHAVQHAHQKGIIHRDLKPSNVLVALYDGRPVPKVIDFGVAKATSQRLTERTVFTQYGQIVGTLEYMSPEQAVLNQLDIDTRSDIYSLGVLLYELLTGTTPFDRQRLRSAAMDEMMRIIREEEPPKPSTRLSSAETLPSIAASRKTEPHKLSVLVRGELDWIVMKALEKDRARRYETANAFAADVQRYLNDEAVEACPPSAGYKFRKFARRNKAALSTAAAIAVALVVGTVVSTWQAVRATRAEALAAKRFEQEQEARHEADAAHQREAQQRAVAEEERDRARNAEKRAQEQRDRAVVAEQLAEANFAKARAAVNEYFTTISETQLLSVPGLQPLRQELLDAALRFYEEFTKERSDDPELQIELADAHYKISRIYAELRRSKEASEAVRQAESMYEELLRAGRDDVRVKHGLARIKFNRASSLRARLSNAKNVANMKRALAEEGELRVLYDKTVSLCNEVVEADAGHVEARRTLGDVHNMLAIAHKDAGDLSASLKMHQEALSVREAVARDEPDNADSLAQLAGSVNNIGTILGAQGRHREALAMYRRAREYILQVREMVPHVILYGRWLAIGHSNVSRVEHNLGNKEAALEALEALVATRRRLVVENPAVPGLKKDLFSDYRRLANYQRSLGRESDAQRSFRAAREILENLPRDTPDDLMLMATVYSALAKSLDEEGDADDEAQAQERTDYADRAIAAVRQAVEGGYNDVALLKGNADLAVIRDREEYQSLVEQVEKSVEAAKLAQNSKGTDEEKLRDRRKALDLLGQLAEEQPDQVRHQITLATTAHSIGLIETGLKNYDEAEKAFQESLDIRRKLVEQEPDNAQYKLAVQETCQAQGELLWARGRRAEAHARWQECLEAIEAIASDETQSREIHVLAVDQARILYQRYGRLGLWDVAAKQVLRGSEVRVVTDAKWHPRLAVVAALLADDETYNQICRDLLKSGEDAPPTHVAWILALRPQTAVEPEKVVEIAQQGVRDDAKPGAWSRRILALAYYRAGRHDEALRELTDPMSGLLAYRRMHALVHHALGHEAQARHWLRETEAAYRNVVLRTLADSDLGVQMAPTSASWGKYWWELAHDQVLRREAWEKIKGTPLPDDPEQHLVQARAYFDLGDTEKARAELAAAAKPGADDWWIWMARARLTAGWDGMGQAAEADWQKCVDLAGDEPLPWIHRGQWLAEQGRHEEADADFATAAELAGEKLNPFLEAGWWVAGPFPGNTDAVLSPETYPDPSKELSIPPDQKSTRWQHVPAEAFGKVDFARPSGELKDASVYALAFIHSEKERDATLKLGTDDSGRLWFNGEQLLSPVSPVYSAFGLHTVRVRLRPGRNTLLVKVHTATGPHYLHARFLEEPLDEAVTLAQEGLWGEAAKLFDRNRSTLPPESTVWRFYAASLVAARADVERYRQFCEAAAAKGTDDFTSTLACGLGPKPMIDVKKLVELADAQIKVSPTNNDRIVALSLAYYRAGRFQEALQRLQQHSAVATEGKCAGLQALIHHGLGNTAAAAQWLVKSRDHFNYISMALRTPSDDSRDVMGWTETLILYAEAAERITGQKVLGEDWQRAWRAQAWLSLGRTKQAEEALQQAIDAEAGDARHWIARGRYYAERGEHEKADADFAKAASLAPNDLNQFLQGGWWVAGPYPAKMDEFCPPEVDPDPSKLVHTVDPATGLSDAPTPWRAVATFQDGHVNARRILSDAAIYAMSYVYSPEERSALLRVDAKQGIRIWINGALVHHRSEPIGGSIWADHVPVVLRPGRNTILVKSPTWYFNVRLADDPRDSVLILAEQRRFGAAAALLKSGSLEPLSEANSTLWVSLLAPLALSGELEGFEAQMQQVMHRYGASTNLDETVWYARMCAQVPNAAFHAFVDRFVQIAEDRVARRAETWAVVNAALVNYRAGRFDRAGEHLDAIKSSGWFSTHALPLRAMLAHQKGETEDAKLRLAEAKAKFKSLCSKEMATQDPTARAGGYWWWYDWLQFQTLLIEAEQIVEGATTVAELAKELEAHYETYWSGRNPLTAAFDHAVFVRPPNNSEDRADPYIARGRRLMQLGRFGEAEADFNMAAQTKPNDPTVLAARAVFHAGRGDADKAAADFDRAFNRLGNRRWRDGVPIDAQVARNRDVFDRLNLLRPEDTFLWWARAAMHVEAGELDDAADALSKISLDAHPTQAYLPAAVAVLQGNIARLDQFRHGERPQQSDYFNTLLMTLAPIDATAQTALLESAGRMLAAQPGAEWPKRLYGFAQYRAGNFNEALPHLRASIKPGGLGWQSNGVSYPLLAMVHYRLGDFEEANRWLERSKLWFSFHQPDAVAPNSGRLGPNNIIPRDWLVLATAYYREAERLVAVSEPLATATEHLRAQEYDDAIAVLSDALQRLPDRTEIWELRGNAHRSKKDFEKAVADYNEALRLDPSSISARLKRSIANREEVLYGGTAANPAYSTLPPGALAALDPEKGVTVSVGVAKLATGGNAGVSGLAFSSQEELFASLSSRTSTPTLVQLDPDSGELLREIGTIATIDGQPLKISDLAMQPGTDVLFGISSTVHKPHHEPVAGLYTIDTSTAVATLVGRSDLSFGGGLAFAADGTLYQSSFLGPLSPVNERQPCLFTLDPATGQVIKQVPLSDPTGRVSSFRYVLSGLAVRPSDGAVFASGSVNSFADPANGLPAVTQMPNLLVRIDPVTGVVTHMGPSPEGIGEKMGDLAFRATKAPQEDQE